MGKHSAVQIRNAKIASKAAYIPPGKIKAKNIPPGYVLDTSRSGRRTKVFRNDSQKHILVAHRGTKTLRDVADDITAVVLGKRKHNKRFQQAKRVVDQTKTAYPDYHITSTGHSLGGTLAQGTKADDTVTFNKGTAIPDLFQKRKANQTDIRKRGDIISFLSRFQRGKKGSTLKNLKGSFNPLQAHKI